VERYQARVSGPLLDRFDLHVEVPRMEVAELIAPSASEPSRAVAERVSVARARQLDRLGGALHGARGAAHGALPGDAANRPRTNADLADGDLRRLCAATPAATGLLAKAVQRLGLSARGYHRVMRVSRTIADLEGASTIECDHMAEALQYRPRAR
jgi:magnesium chelatase family protein